MKRKFKLILFFISLSFGVFAQEDSTKKASPFQLNGYIKDLKMLIIDGKGNSQNISFLHNRLKMTYQINDALSLKGEIRNRVFYGPGFEYRSLSDQLNFDAGRIDMNFVPIKDKSIVFSTQIDRLSANWSHRNLEVTLGRQRINWGINLVWNPNDLFNTLNFTDFDYEERPGSDALRVQYFKGMNGFETAASLHRNIDSSIVGFLYKYNIKGYDLQGLASYYRGEAALGGGWAGSLKNIGFKGEFTWFSGTKNVPSLWMASPSLDYTFNNGIFAAASFLYRSASANMTNSPLLMTGAASSNLDVKSLMPNRYSAFIQSSVSFSPVLSASAAGIYAIDLNAFFLMPNLSWSVKENMELLFLSQSYFLMDKGSINAPFHSFFVRYKWNF